MNVERLLRELGPVLGFDPYKVTPTQKDEVLKAIEYWLEDFKVRAAVTDMVERAALAAKRAENLRPARRR